jgi:hypothetical protein
MRVKEKEKGRARRGWEEREEAEKKKTNSY